MDIKDIDNFSPYEVLSDQFKNRADWDRFFAQYSELSLATQGILMDEEAMEYLLEIARDYNLQLPQSRNLSLIIAQVVMGDMFVGEMTNQIMQKVVVDQNTAVQITGKIIGELFAPAMEDIKKIQREKFAGRLSQSSSAAAQPPQKMMPAATPPPATPRAPTSGPRIIPPPPRSPSGVTPDVGPNNVVDLRNKPQL